MDQMRYYEPRMLIITSGRIGENKHFKYEQQCHETNGMYFIISRIGENEHLDFEPCMINNSFPLILGKMERFILTNSGEVELVDYYGSNEIL